jgi:[ribosomal protein S5]-alanine N-acetyltransferase
VSADHSISFGELRTDRLLLRPLREEDRAAFVGYHEKSREHLRPWSPRMPDGVTLEQFFTQQLERSQRGMRDGTVLRLGAFVLTDGVLVGMFNLNNIVRGVFECADAGWQVGTGHTGQDLATEGVWALLDIAFANPPRGLSLHRVQANIIPQNGPSLRVAEKCGFRREGLAKKMLKINGAWQDHVMHAKLADEHVGRYVR